VLKNTPRGPAPARAYVVRRRPFALSLSRGLVRDLALADFIDKRTPRGRKRTGIPKRVLHDAKVEFGLASKSAILRAYDRGKRWRDRLPYELQRILHRVRWQPHKMLDQNHNPRR
jgi:hypothetical protein